MNNERPLVLRILKTALPFLLCLIVFLISYSSASHLPVLGDGSFHAYAIEEIATKGTAAIDTEVYYPLFYHLFGALIYSLGGITAVKIIAPLMMALSALLIYLIAKELTKSKFVALTSIIIIAFSSKVIWYGSQILMEPFMIFFVVAVTYAVLLLHKKQNIKTVIFTAILMGMAISTKQQALFLIIAIPFFLLLNRMEIKKIAVLAGLTILVALGPYLWLVSTNGSLIQPSSCGSFFQRAPDSVIICLSESNSIADQIIFGIGDYQIPDWSRELEEESDGIDIYNRGTEEHEARHLYIWDMANPIKFLWLNSLQTLHFWRGFTTPAHIIGFVLLQILLISGFLFSLGYSVKRKEWRIIPCVVFTSWLFTFWGSDSLRYFLHLPVLMGFLCLLPIKLTFDNFKLPQAKLMTVFMLIVILTVPPYVIRAGINEQAHVKELENTQCYASSEGGISSIEETGKWLKEHTGRDDVVFGTSINEWTYYSGMEAFWDYRVYFLPPDRLDHYLKLWGVKYLLVRDNQIVSDDNWSHLEFYPRTFYENVQTMYHSPVYISSHGDIEVYEIDYS